jgi:MFS family permease
VSLKISLNLSKIIGGNFAKKFGGKNVLTFAVLIWSLITLITPIIASSVKLLVLSRITLGLAEGVALPAIVQIFSTCVLVDERSRAFGYLIGLGSVGQTFAAIVTFFVLIFFYFNSIIAQFILI